MLKKTMIIILVVMALNLTSKVYLPKYYLKGVNPVIEDQIDLYKVKKSNLNFSRKLLLLGSIKLKTITEVDYDNETVELRLFFENLQLYRPVYLTLESYLQHKIEADFRNSLQEKKISLLEETGTSANEGLFPEIVIDLPKMALPRAVRKFMGNKAGRLSLDGSQKLTISGHSTSTDYPGNEGDQNQNFDLELKQDLNLNLKGTIGEKIHVNVSHHTSSDDSFISEPNDINISYKGFEDEVIKSIEGGDINLSLSGSKFISASASSEGLFGIKTIMEFGSLKLTAILGKDEAKKSSKKYNGSNQSDSLNIDSKNYVNRTYYFIDDPDALYSLYTEADGLSEEKAGWINNAVKTDASGSWIVKSPQLLPDIGSVKVYLDDSNANNNVNAIEGSDIDGNGTFMFDLLTDGSDYIMDYDIGILKINTTKALSKNYTLGVVYTRGGEPVGSYSIGDLSVKLLQIGNQDPDVYPEFWKLQARNIYSLGNQNIKNEGFKMDIFTYGADNSRNFYNGDGVLYNDYLRLDINGDGSINGDDATIDLLNGFIVFPFLQPFEPLGDEIIYEEDYVSANETEINIGVRGKVGRETINLNQINILTGSVSIKLTTVTGTITLKENTDYIVDYDFGSITFLNQEAKNSDNDIDISYQFKPLFSVDSKTLMGIRADMNVSDNAKIGGTFIYQNEKVTEDRPKIGNENRSIILADVDGEVVLEAPFLTSMVDMIPLIKTDEESEIKLSGEIAMSIPSIYGSDEQDDPKEAYIDDMESILDSYPLGVTRRTWVKASKPFNSSLIRSNINWYNPQNIQKKDVYDPSTLSDKEEDEKASVLACKINPPTIGNPGTDNVYWSGIMKYVGDQVDFSEKKYLEFLVKVDSLPGNISVEPIVMHINLGDVNEDYYTDYGGEGILNSEDGISTTFPDGSLDVGEDLGLDMIANHQPGDDPNDRYDNEDYTIDGDVEYPYVNGTENNSYLDTEDLNGDGYLTMTDVYYEFSVSLTDEENPYLNSQYKDWKLFRIPLDDAENYNIISYNDISRPELKKISYARIWFETRGKARIKIVSADIVGNKWENTAIRDKEGNLVDSDDEFMVAGVIDNQKSPEYHPAPGSVIKKDNEETLEQSLILDYQNLRAGHTGLVRQFFHDQTSQNKGLDLRLYEEIRFWAYSSTDSPSESDSLVIRFGADSLNYYQISYPLDPEPYNDPMVKSGWKPVNVKFSELTELKNISAQDTSYFKVKDGITYKFSKKGNPTLSNIKEFRLGLQAGETFTGRLYFDDIRVADPFTETGYAARADFHTSFADFSTLDINLNWKTPNFQSSTRRQKSGSFNQSLDLNITNKYNLHKFFPPQWGFNLPLTLSRNWSKSIPRFKTNSDILRETLLKDEKEREQSRKTVYGATLNFSQNKKPKSKILEYVVKNTSINTSIQQTKNLTPTTVDTTLTYTAKHSYKLDFSPDDIDIKIFEDYNLYFLPSTFTNALTYKATFPKKWRWDTYSDSVDQWVPQTSSDTTKTLNTESYIKYDLTSDLGTTWKLTTKRDLMLDGDLWGMPLGHEKTRNQTITLDFSPDYIDRFMSISGDANVKYKQEHKKQSATSESEFLYYGNNNRSLGCNGTLRNRDLLNDFVTWLGFDKSPAKSDKNKDKTKGKTKGKTVDKREDKSKNYNKNTNSMEMKEGEKKEYKSSEERRLAMEKEKEESYKRLKKDRDKETKEQDSVEKKLDEPNVEEEEKGPRFNPINGLINYLTNLENINVSYDNIYVTYYEKRIESPEILYQFGLPHIIPDAELNKKTITEKYSANTGLALFSNLNTDWSYNYEFKRTYENPAENYGTQTKTTTFPSVSATLTEFEKLIKAENILTSSRIQTSYTVTEVHSGDIDWDNPKTVKKTTAFQPLLSWTGNWINNISSNLSYNYYISESITDNGEFNSITSEERKSMNGNFSWTFSAERGIKLPFAKKKIRFTNEMTAEISFNYEDSKSTQKGSGASVTNRDMTKLTISPGASYKFSKNVRGGLTSNYDNTNNKKNQQKIKIFSLGVWIEILF